MDRFDEERIATELAHLPEWRREGVEIVRDFTFASYLDGLAFVQRIGEEAERRDHHPDLELGYRRLTVRLSSHDVNGLSARDFRLAEWIESAFSADV